jgi:hypothetical protein
MRLRAFALLAVAAAVCAAPGTASGKPPTGGGTSTTYAGRAYVLDANLTVLSTNVHVGPISDTGQLPASGGYQAAQVLTLDNPAPLFIHTGVLTASTAGAGNEASSYASVLDAHVNLNNVIDVQAGLLQSVATARCVNGAATYSGGSDIALLSITALGNAVTVPLAAPPNTSIVIPNLATIWINHQYMSNGRFVVNALEVHVGGALAGLTTADVVVSHAEAGISCGPSVPPCAVLDFVTGGGWISVNGDRGTFGLVGGQKPNGLQGHLNYIDHGTGQHITGDTVTSYSGTGTSRTLTFTNSSGDQIRVTVADNGEPGTNDTFSISSGSYSAGGTLVHGNIQLHHPGGCPTGGKHGR